MTISKNQKRLLEFLGPEYSIKEIDQEPCIYRKINSQYDIEISRTFRKSKSIAVYVWSTSPNIIVEKHFNISSDDELKLLLTDLLKKYQDLA